MAAGRDTTKKSHGVLEQWASSVTGFSSQYDSQGWSANATLGQPKVYPMYGDIRGAWAQGMCSDSEYIQLAYQSPVYVSSIHIYETLNCGGIKKICVRAPNGAWEAIWETDIAEQLEQARIFSPDFETTPYRTSEVRLDIDCSLSGSWVEIDAVQVVGRKLKIDSPPSLSELAKDFATLVNDRDSSDVTFRVDDTDVYAHRVILMARSPTFRGILKTEYQKDVITIDNMAVGTFLGALHYLYSGEVPDNYSPPTLVDVWRAAHRFEIVGLQLLCVTLIDENISVDNAVEVYVKASTHDPVAGDIQEVCLEYLFGHLSQVSMTQDFKDLPQHIMLELIQNATAKLALT